MRSMYWQLAVLGTISAFAFRHRETKGHRETNETQMKCFTPKGIDDRRNVLIGDMCNNLIKNFSVFITYHSECAMSDL